VEEFIVFVHDSIWSLVKSRDGSFGHSLFYISSFAAVTTYIKKLNYLNDDEYGNSKEYVNALFITMFLALGQENDLIFVYMLCRSKLH
jgi:hypothetical protein